MAAGIRVETSSNVTITGNFIGTNPAGTLALGNDQGILIDDSSLVVVGGSSPADRNLISGNNARGVMVEGATSTDNRIAGNYIGTNPAGNAPLRNAFTGVVVFDARGTIIGGTPNLISGNGGPGVSLFGASDSTIANNKIGTDVTGNTALRNDGSGISVDGGANNVIVSNLISGNRGAGINIFSSTANTRVLSNLIGTNAGGDQALGNTGAGVIADGQNTLIGGEDRNTISANFQGVLVPQTANGVRVEYNYIGTDRAGLNALGNQADGIFVIGGSTNTSIGSEQRGNLIFGNGGNGVLIQGSGGSGNRVEGNVIGPIVAGGGGPGNGGAGLRLEEASGILVRSNSISLNRGPGVVLLLSPDGIQGWRNRITQNSISHNDALGIDLSASTTADGVTPNDPLDADSGSNNLQNFPVITSATRSSASIFLQGTLSSAPAVTYTVELFANTVCDPSGHGEGQDYLGSTIVTTDSAGNASFELFVTLTRAVGNHFTATATDPLGNTSEFSACAGATYGDISTPSATVVPTSSPTHTGTAAATSTGTAAATSTATAASTSTPAQTGTATATRTPTRTSTATGTPTPTAIPFTDVPADAYYYIPVQYLARSGAISGYTSGPPCAADQIPCFKPFNNTTRGQMVKIIVVAEAFPITTPSAPTFNDVPANHPFYQFVETAAARQIVSGYSDGSFRPFADVTRGQLSKIVTVAAGWELVNPPNPTFRDVPREDAFYTFVETAAEKGVISGYECGLNCLEFRPYNNAVRAQIAKIVYLAVTTPRSNVALP